jgi:DNA-binding transcriptional ArsR family regulator
MCAFGTAVRLAELNANVYVCNMDVVIASPEKDPLVQTVAQALAPLDLEGAQVDISAETSPSWHPAGARAALIVGPPGFGKSSVLAAAADLTARRAGARVLSISGSIVASEGHLARLLSRVARPADVPHEVGTREALRGAPAGTWSNPATASTTDRAEHGAGSLDVTCAALAASATPILVAIDDIDALVFKRERVTERLVEVVASPAVRLIASCLPAAAERFLGSGHPFAAALAVRGGRVTSVALAALEDEQARTLVRRRAPRLSEAVTAMVVAAGGGHPAALVFLSRLAELRGATAARQHAGAASPQDATRLAKLFDRAAEFAGAVYAEPWAALGPQQRAVLWQLSAAPGPTTAAEVAAAIDLPPSHVSAQLTRLVADGLVRRTGVRGQFVVAPLLASWIARRAARAQGVGERRGGHDGKARASADLSAVSGTARDEGPLDAPVVPGLDTQATAAGVRETVAADRARGDVRRGGRRAVPALAPLMASHNGRATVDGASMTHRGAAGHRRPRRPGSPVTPAAPRTPERTPRTEEA